MPNKFWLRRLIPVIALLSLGYALWVGWNQGYWSPSAQRVPRADLVLQDGVLHLKGSEKPFVGFIVEKTTGDKLLSEIPVWRGKAHGTSRGWHLNGQLEVEEHFVHGVSEGIRTRWHANGQKRNEASIKEGELNGSFTEWHENGQLSLRMDMVKGKGEGLCEAWHPDGKPKSKVTLKNGEPVKTEYFASSVPATK
jgi:antitoxin component YwqK of YwqJK toxin-antitoxin module